MAPATKYLSRGLLLALILCCSGTAEICAADKMPLRVGFHLDHSRYETNYAEKDIMVATEVLFEKLLSKEGRFEPDFITFRSRPEYFSAVVAGELDYLEFGPLFWLSLPEATRAKITPVSVIQLGEERLDRFVLLAPPGATLGTLGGKRIRIDTGSDRGVASAWANYELLEAGFPVIGEHFGAVEPFKKSTDVLLPTFFGKADACIVREDDYLIASELNPQIARRLTPVKTSPEFPLVITAVAGPNRAAVLSRLGGSATIFLGRPVARQALSLLRIKDVTAYQESDLDGLKAIVARLETTGALTAVKNKKGAN